MANTENARYDFSLCDVLITPLNDDLTQPTITNIIGGVGPFDFSGVSVPTTVPFTTKIGNAAAVSVNVDVTTAVLNTAVTVAELVTAITTAAPTDITVSAEAVTGRLKIVYSGAGSPTRLQAYGECNTLALIGQGKGVRTVYSDTMKSFGDNPNLKDEETFTTTNGKGIDAEVTSDGYRKGVAGALTDTAGDYLLRSMIEGGTYDETTLKYDTPTSLTRKIYFKIELYAARYLIGTQKEAEIAGYIQEEVFSCKGSFTDRTRERGFTDWVYNYTATPQRDGSDITADTSETQLTVAEYLALNLGSIAA